MRFGVLSAWYVTMACMFPAVIYAAGDQAGQDLAPESIGEPRGSTRLTHKPMEETHGNPPFDLAKWVPFEAGSRSKEVVLRRLWGYPGVVIVVGKHGAVAQRVVALSPGTIGRWARRAIELAREHARPDDRFEVFATVSDPSYYGGELHEGIITSLNHDYRTTLTQEVRKHLHNPGGLPVPIHWHSYDVKSYPPAGRPPHQEQLGHNFHVTVDSLDQAEYQATAKKTHHRDTFY